MQFSYVIIASIMVRDAITIHIVRTIFVRHFDFFSITVPVRELDLMRDFLRLLAFWICFPLIISLLRLFVVYCPDFFRVVGQIFGIKITYM